MTQEPESLRPVRLCAFVVFVCLFLFQVFGLLSVRRAGREDLHDFRAMYVAGYMVRAGHRADLYNYGLQESLQNALVRPERPLPFDHLAYETLLFVPFSYFGYRQAYYLFLAFNVLLLIVAQRLSRSQLLALEPAGKLVPEAIFYCFFPVLLAILQGQDSIVLLTLAVLASRALEARRDAQAGFFYSLGFFKFQFILPVVLLFLLWRKWKFVAGAIAGSFLVTCVSVAITGFAGARAFALMLLQIGSAVTQAAEQVKFSTHTAAMPNLTGFFESVCGPYLPGAAVKAMILASTGLVIWFAMRARPSLPLALAVTTLVSYHGFLHDASLLVLPIGVFLGRALSERNWLSAVSGMVVFVAPTFLIGMNRYGAPMAVLTLGLFFLWRRDFERAVSSTALEANYTAAES